jgi:hypothetical protein
MSVPIIFCHYGKSNYLRYTLFSAKLSNPNKTIYLIGDDQNEKLCSEIGIKHIKFSQFDNSILVSKFHEKFKFISGKKHGREEWTKFVFLRWFYICEFVYSNDIDSFWHFDSDNLIISDLFPNEEFFNNYDNTEQCGGSCMNGYISSKKITQMYVCHILELFSDDEFLNIQIKKCSDNEHFAFTEMAAYNHFKKAMKINTVRLNKLLNGDTFDDCLAFGDGMVHSKDKYNGYTVKEIYLNPNFNFYFKLSTSNEYVKINSINLSWMPLSFILKLFFIFCRSRIPFIRKFRSFFKLGFEKIDYSTYSYFQKFIDRLIYHYIKVKY